MKSELRTMVRSAYDLQKLRISMGNRIAANFRAKLGQEPGEKLEDSEALKILADIKQRFGRLTHGLVHLPGPSKFTGDEIITSWTELALIAQWTDLEKQEKQHFRRLVNVLQDFPVYTKVLEPIAGVGPAMAGVLIGEIDIEKARYPSSLWKYAGLDVGDDGAGRSRRAEHLVDREYTAADGEVKTRKSITFNAFLKTKLIGVLATSLLRCGNKHYGGIYADYKHRLESKWPDTSKGHRHNAALRYMVKMFLVDLHVAWRELERLPVTTPYSEGKLGIVHGADRR